MSYATLAGVDPGLSGGLALRIGDVLSVCPLPESPHDLLDRLAGVPKPAAAFVEKLPFGIAGKVNPSAMAKLHRSGGIVAGILTALGWTVYEVHPKTWQSALHLGARADHGKRWKAHLRDEAQRRHPDLSVTLKTADAILLLDYGIAALP